MNTRKFGLTSVCLLMLSAPVLAESENKQAPPPQNYRVAQMTENYDGPVLRDFKSERSEINDYKFDAYPDASADSDDMDRGIDNNLLIGSFVTVGVIAMLIALYKRKPLNPEES